MRVDLFDYELPPELIAQEPLAERDAARLLHIGPRLADRHIRDLPDLLRPGDLLVLNDTRVLPTRFWGRRLARPIGGPEAGTVPIEATLVEASGDRRWWALCRPGKRLRAADRVELGPRFEALVERKDADGRVLLAFELEGADLLAAIRAHGAMPLPPYIRRATGGRPLDQERYQTVFGRREGSVAAPTASLHFTKALLARLAERGVERTSITLHVGMGTFAPVKAADTEAHVMHPEWYEVPPAAAEAIATTRRRGGRVVAVGTTVMRTLESAATDDGLVAAEASTTSLFITPGFRFRVVDLLLTNFHLPRSTLFMLVCAFGGIERLKAAYAHAIARRYRFFSYGDACLIERAPPGD